MNKIADQDDLREEDTWWSVEDYKRALLRLERKISPLHRRMLKAHAEAADHTLSVRQLAAAGGYSAPHVTYSQYGRLARIIAQELGETEEWSVWTRVIGHDFRSELAGC